MGVQSNKMAWSEETKQKVRDKINKRKQEKAELVTKIEFKLKELRFNIDLECYYFARRDAFDLLVLLENYNRNRYRHGK